MATIGGGVWSRALRHRNGQALVLFLLATLITAGASFPALYVRATEQAIVALDLHDHSVVETGLQITSRSRMEAVFATAQDQEAVSPAGLLALVPHPSAHGFGTPVRVLSAYPTAYPDHTDASIGNLASFSGQCRHLRFVRGRCPRAANEIAVTAADLATFHLHLGQHTAVASVPVGKLPPQPDPNVITEGVHPHQVPIRLRIVGIYRQVPGPYWFKTVLGEKSGQVDHTLKVPHLAHDYWLTVPATFAVAGDPPLFAPHSHPPLPMRSDEVRLPLDPARTDLDTFEGLRGLLHRLDARLGAGAGHGTIDTVTGIPDLLDDLTHQQHQTRVIVPLAVVQLVLLTLFVLSLVLAAMTGQRRPEVALALLRGRGRRGARRQLVAELLPAALAGVPVGAGVAIALAAIVRRVALPPGAPLEAPGVFWWSVLAAAVTLVLLVLQAVLHVTRQPVEALLRRVPGRSGSRIGTAELLLLAASGTATAAFLGGELRGAAALCGPAVLALLVGLLLARVVTLTSVLGRRALRRGRLRAGLVLLDAARSPAARRGVAVVAVASALLVFSADAFAVGVRNRQLQAEQVVGASSVLSVDSMDLAALRSAVQQADPTGHRATPVVTVTPPGAVGPTTLAVVPDGFARVTAARAAVASLPLRRLRPPPRRPLRINGTHVSLSVSTNSLQVSGLGVGIRPHLVLGLLLGAGDPGSVDLGTLPAAGTTRRLGAAVSCGRGCVVTHLGVTGSPGTAVRTELALGELQTDRGAVALGAAGTWTRTHGSAGSMGAVSAGGIAGPGGLVVDADTAQSNEVDLQQGWLPTTVPAIVSGALPPSSSGNHFALTGLDVQSRPGVRVARAPRIPGGPADTALVDLETLARGSAIDPTDQLQVWLATTDPTLRHRVVAALASHGLRVTSTATLGAQRTAYDRSASAWGLALGRVVGVLALLLAVLVLIVVAATTWRTRARDVAALRMAGVPGRVLGRVVVGGQLLAVVPAVLAGTETGILGAGVALRSIPLFTQPPEVPVQDIATPWPAALVAGAAALVVLGVAGWLTGRTVARRGDLDRLRET